MAARILDKIITGVGQGDIVVRLAKVADMRRIQMLYAEVYGPNYPVTIVTDKEQMRRAIEDDDYYWLVAECGGRVIGSLVYALSLQYRYSKAFGAVVSLEYRKLNLAYTMMKLVLDDITKKKDLVDLVYATTRTANYAPQKLTESLGFVKLGIFPNTHKVQDNETHCLTAYFTEGALARRRKKPVIIPEVLPYYELIRRQLPLEKAVVRSACGLYSDRKQKIPLLNFEVITAPEFIKRRYRKSAHTGFFEHIVMPFHEPNLLLITPDQRTQVYLTYSTKDKYSVIVGGQTDEESSAVVLESVARKVSELDMAYLEVIIDAYEPALQRDALDARFIPSAYFPCAKRMGRRRDDCVVFSRTFDVLDFRNVKIISLYRNFLKEYLKLWRENYIDLAFREEGK
jgi:RimJ/RimL family protein N-acetyltransferase